MPRLDDLLAGVTRVGLDTMSVIYDVEANPQYVALMDVIFDRVANGRLSGAASTITLLEVLVKPLRLGAVPVADRYRDLLTDSENFETLPVTQAVAEDRCRPARPVRPAHSGLGGGGHGDPERLPSPGH